MLVVYMKKCKPGNVHSGTVPSIHAVVSVSSGPGHCGSASGLRKPHWIFSIHIWLDIILMCVLDLAALCYQCFYLNPNRVLVIPGCPLTFNAGFTPAVESFEIIGLKSEEEDWSHLLFAKVASGKFCESCHLLPTRSIR